ncbi:MULTISPECIES: hypothetical protein [unclassified Frondihabitans]|jgi:hypothetical protein|nr:MULTISPECIES: hypothetical protein [unclassified Frondihabitans]MBF4576757.1 hypothetical protein [Frondihabitans sp. VKM Ac-2883]RPE76529.1 hypothetical protein EDF37_2357 [Frondihabitans sp. PhB153]RPF05196.1 hypothetical protein EDF39_1892 [Frondihabitans sp. PhB161]
MDDAQLHDEGVSQLALGAQGDYGDYGRVSVSDDWLEERIRLYGSD